MEANPLSRFVDFSCVTDWEYLVSDLEGLLRKWGLQDGVHAATTPREEPIRFLGELLRARLVVHPAANAAAGPPARDDGRGAAMMLLDDEDAAQLGKCWEEHSSRADGVCQLFGLRGCVVVECHPDASPFWSSTSAALRDQQHASSLLSALAVAACQAQCQVPIAVVVGDAKVVTGFAASPEVRLRLQSDVRSDVGLPFRRLDGLLELFRAKLGCLSPGPAGLAIRISVRHTWKWERPWDRARKTRWRSWNEEQVQGALQERARISPQRLQRRRWRQQQRVWELHGRMASTWGAAMDPLQRLQVAVCWLDAREGVFTESPTATSLRPLEARPRSWTVRCDWVHGETSSRLARQMRRLLAAYVHAQCLPRDAVFADLTFRTVEDLGGQSEAADAVGAVLSEAAFAQVQSMRESAGPVPMDPDAKEAAQRASTEWFADAAAASALAEGNSAEMAASGGTTRRPHGMYDHRATAAPDTSPSSSSPPPPLMTPPSPPSAAAAAGGGGGTFGAPSPPGSPLSPHRAGRSLWSWHPHSAPIGRLVSLLALEISRLDDLPAMAALWVSTCAQMRQCWDTTKRLPLMAPDPVVDNDATPSCQHLLTPPEPDLQRCLLMQKLQLLDLCIHHQPQAEAEAEAPHQLPPDAAPAAHPPAPASTVEALARSTATQLGPSAEASAGDGVDGFFDVAEEEPVYLLLHPARRVRAPELLVACPLTSDLIRQRQVLLSQMQAGDSLFAQVHQQLRLAQLRSAMQSFKAENPGCVFADFARWYAPSCWEVDVEADAAGGLPPGAAEVRLVWPGHGAVCVDAADDGQDAVLTGRRVEAEWTSLWTTTLPVPSAQQKPLFHVAQEAEKALHFLETLSPVALLSQMLVAAASAAHFVLAEAPTLARTLPAVQAELARLDDAAGQAINALRESEDFDSFAPPDGLAAAAVSQSALLACDRFCAALETAELQLSRGASLLHKLPGRTGLVEKLLSASSAHEHSDDGSGASSRSDFVVVVDDPDDRDALLQCCATRAGPPPPRADVDQIIDGLLEGEAPVPPEMAASVAAVAEDAAGDQGGNERDGHGHSVASSTAASGTGAGVEAEPSRREYLFRWAASVPCYERASTGASTTLPVRFYARVDGPRERDPVRLAMTMAESSIAQLSAE